MVGGASVLQTTGGVRLVVDSNVKPVAVTGHPTTTLVPAWRMPNVGDATTLPQTGQGAVGMPS